MNIICDNFPNALDIGGEMFKINSDLKTWLKVTQTIEEETDNITKVINIINLVFPPQTLPKKLDETLNAIIKFYCGNNSEVNRAKGKENANKKRIVSFWTDSDYIYCAFLSQYGIDLLQSDMHWWKFLALFSGLSGEHRILKIMEWRGADLSKIKDKAVRSQIRTMQRLYKLPELKGKVLEDSEIAEVFANAF